MYVCVNAANSCILSIVAHFHLFDQWNSPRNQLKCVKSELSFFPSIFTIPINNTLNIESLMCLVTSSARWIIHGNFFCVSLIVYNVIIRTVRNEQIYHRYDKYYYTFAESTHNQSWVSALTMWECTEFIHKQKTHPCWLIDIWLVCSMATLSISVNDLSFHPF